MSFLNNSTGSSGFGSGGGFGSGTGGFGSSGGFGSTTQSTGFGGFGSNQSNSSGFGKPAFGAPAASTGGTGLFGSGSTTGGFGSGTPGGFGSTANNTSGGFGSNTGTGLFGANKPATSGFGTANTGSSIFGSGSTGGFGSTTNNTGSGFGSNTNTGFGSTANAGGNNLFSSFGGSSNAAATNNNSGTASVPFNPVTEKDTTSGTSVYQSITCQDQYKNKSFEELRAEDYAQGRRFGNQNGQAGAFGQSTGFGGFGQSSNTGFGQGSTTGFGSQSSTNTTNNPFGGFGQNTNNTSSGFGSNTNSNPFGANTTNTSTTNTGFGSTNTGTGGFGSGTGFGGTGTGFGSQDNQQQSGFGSNNATNPFGQTQQNQQQNTTFGSGFGTNANTNTGGFGSGSSLFGSNNNQQQQQQQQNTGFGASTNSLLNPLGQQNKPGESLFGSSTQNTQTAGSVFGGANTQQNTANPFKLGDNAFGSNTNTTSTSSPFSTSLNTNNNIGSVFGAKPATSQFGGTTNNSVFGSLGSSTQQSSPFSLGGNNNNNTGSSIFGTSTNQQQQPPQQNNSLLSSQSTQQQVPSHLHASVTSAPYGNEPLFASLTAPSEPVGPLVTPLSGAKTAQRKAPSLMASMRINSPMYSPRATTGSLGRPGGYGFSSTYGSPTSSLGGSLTPGASSMLKPTGSFGSALSSRLGKSTSLSNLRGDALPQRPSLLRQTPGSGSLRRLTIDRSLRTDLFMQSQSSSEETPKRTVSFEEPVAATPPSNERALVRAEPEEPAESSELFRAQPDPNGGRLPMTQVNGSGPLTTVAEDAVAKQTGDFRSSTGELGDYWTKPPMADLKSMNRSQLQRMPKLKVGREGVGFIEFGPCDISNVDLDEICGGIVKLITRSATVYQDDTNKPPMGQGLNVPSLIHLENSWPRSHASRKAHVKDGKELEKHITRLKRVHGTKFVDYDANTGVWTFKVDHFTTYGLDDDDESGMDEPETPVGQNNSDGLDDTLDILFDGTNTIVPGQFVDTEDMDTEESALMSFEDPFGLSVDGPEQDPALGNGAFAPPPMLRSILKSRTVLTSPQKLVTESWEEQLLRTRSPKKRDRQLLREQQPLYDMPLGDDSLLAQSVLGKRRANDDLGKSQAFRSSMDIMNSLWSNEGSEMPPFKKPRSESTTDSRSPNAIGPSFSASGTLVYGADASAAQVSGEMEQCMPPVVGNSQDIRFARFAVSDDPGGAALRQQMDLTKLDTQQSIPFASVEEGDVVFTDVALRVEESRAQPTALGQREMLIWRLCGSLYDPIEVAASTLTENMTSDQITDNEEMLALDTLGTMLSRSVQADVQEGIRRARNEEEKALHLLTLNDKVGARQRLSAAQDVRLAILISQLPGTNDSRETMRQQIVAWQKRRDWSEMSDAVRALYCIVAGIVNVVPDQGSMTSPEDRVGEFCIADRFSLTWKQSLNLRILYGGYNSLSDALSAYCDDVDAAGSMEPKPSGLSTGEDTLMLLCRLYAKGVCSKSEDDMAMEPQHQRHPHGAKLDELYDAKAVSGSPLRFRLAWQLATMLQAKVHVGLEEAKMNQLTVNFASELETMERLQDSAWVLLHLADADQRKRAVEGVLQRQAAQLNNPTTFSCLQDGLKLPSSLLHTTLAFWHQSNGDYVSQAHSLILAGKLDDAHDVLITTVGPRAVIEEDYDGLSHLISSFTQKPATWPKGGQVYESFLNLLDSTKPESGDKALRTLKRNLRGVEPRSLEQKVAFLEMTKVGEHFGREYLNTTSSVVKLHAGAEAVDMLNAYRRVMAR
ncbi:hypothetical protein K470DRAFT_294782 [Piedraia hortae CBS 480.64]|uniref:Peptidase S59 domain-containing protein n=1 Tax=Piedraia hortae CBS 480.64 TaxID=1314780 RepID=A0A6A7BZH9_9PEZI|nr:hypothetical protein K470DRAFT_294782 [Piedraia hortae CBS 480.64]